MNTRVSRLDISFSCGCDTKVSWGTNKVELLGASGQELCRTGRDHKPAALVLWDAYPRP